MARFDVMKKRESTTLSGKERHWLKIGEGLLIALRSRGDSADAPEIDFLKEGAAQYGKSSHTIRKIIDATIWVDAFFPHLIKEPPPRFPMTNALQLRAIHRLDPNRAEAMSHDVFEGLVTRQHLTEIVAELRGVYRPKAKRTDDVSGSGFIPGDAKTFENQVREALKSLLDEERFPSKPVISDGSGVLPRCDFLIRQDDEPKIAIEAKDLLSKASNEKMLHLLGNLALWQSQGLSTWLFVPADAYSRIEKLQAMAAECRLDPVEVYVVNDARTVRWEPPADDLP